MPNNLENKRQLFEQCNQLCQTKIKTIQFQIEEISKALTSETKSSAGDKHETGRAMLQLEREKLGNQLAEQQKVEDVLSRIQVDKTSETIGLGSLVYTSKANYFIAISAGQLKVYNCLFYAISALTPIGKLLLGKKAGAEIQFRDQLFVIEKVT